MTHKTVYEALAAVNRDIDAIGKNQKNQQQGFQYRGIDDAYNALHDLFAKHGLVTFPQVTQAEFGERLSRTGGVLFTTRLWVNYVFMHESGSNHVVGPVVGEAMDSGDKGSNKALAVAHKYALFQTFTIPTLFTDPDSEVHQVVEEVATEEQLAAINEELWDYLPKVTQSWVQKNPKMSKAQAEKILHKAKEAYAKEQAPAKDEVQS